MASLSDLSVAFVTAYAAVVVIGLQVDAYAIAQGESLLAEGFAAATNADFVGQASELASPAVLHVRIGVYACVSALS